MRNRVTRAALRARWSVWRDRRAATVPSPERRFGRRGLAALVGGFLLAVGVWGVLDLTADDLSGDPVAVSVAGALSAQSQRLALDLSLVAAADDGELGPALDMLTQDLDRLEEAHDGLISGDVELGLTGRPPASVNEVLFDEPVQLDSTVRTFVADVRALLTRSAGDPDPARARSLADQAGGELADGYLVAADRYAADSLPPVERVRALALAVLIGFVVLAGFLGLLVVQPMRRLIRAEGEQLAAARALREVESRRHGLTARLVEAFEMAETEQASMAVIGNALAEILPERPAELLLAGPTGAEIASRAGNAATGAPGCAVPSLGSCPAVRRSQRIDFASSHALNACPHLRDRGGEPCGSVCVPVSFMGRSLGVLHTTGPEGLTLDDEHAENLGMLATHAGLRIGTLRSMARVEEQATTDSLTGLLNRRALHQRVEALIAAGTPIAVALADLDHFKRLNDELGHERGDQALRLFSALVESSLREGDLTGRWGGEEFVLVFTGVDRHEAARAAERLRGALASAVRTAGAPAFTVSMGIVDSSMAPGFDELVRLADRALAAAKGRGRDQVVIGSLRDPDAVARRVMADALGAGDVVDLESEETAARLARRQALPTGDPAPSAPVEPAAVVLAVGAEASGPATVR
jgi:diguanylate cyclase (GGDEF)-like protein